MAHKQLHMMVVSYDVSLPGYLEGLWPAGAIKVQRISALSLVLSCFERETFDVLIVTSHAFKAGEIDGEEVLEVIAAKCPATQVVFLAEPQDIDGAMAVIQAGSYPYARLPVSDEALKQVIETAVDHRPAVGPNLLLRGDEAAVFSDMTGESPAMKAVFKQIDLAAGTDIPVLIQGETGTGKDLVAQAIHARSGRCRGPFVPVHIGSLPPELVGSELFGHEKGAFTSALQRRQGKFEQGGGGTVFLDEIGAIDEKMQISLLRLLEQKRFHRLGGDQLIDVDVRLIAATHEDLPELVRQGRFRDDLFFRLDVFRMVVPPLRDRLGDVPLLAQVFLDVFNGEFQKGIARIDPACMQRLEAYPWPGNVRELKHVIQRAVLVCEGDVLKLAHLPPRFQKDNRQATVSFSIGTPLETVEREMIVRTLHATGDNRKKTAECLGISRRSLYNKLKKYGIG